MKYLSFLLLVFCVFGRTFSYAQNTDQIVQSSIHSVKLYKSGDQTSFPVIVLNSSDALELHFDDLDGDVKNYYYSFVLCNADWSTSMLRTFEYTQGFQSVRITDYRNSSISLTRYTHYQAFIPDRSSYPTRSGNYLLKVFLNGDTSQLVLTRRFVVVDSRAKVGAVVQQPFNARLYNSAQKLQIAVTTDSRMQVFSPTDLKLVVLQNNNWQTALHLDRPTIYRGNYYEYNDEESTIMPAGKEFRWIDLRSFRLKSDRMQELVQKGDKTEVFVKPESRRLEQPYVYYRDLDGSYTIEALESINPFWQSDYATVHFSYFPPDNKPFAGKDLYMVGEFTQYAADTSGKMTFNADRGAYEKSMFLKQGYYNYNYATIPAGGGKQAQMDMSQTEGHYWGTENSYVVLVYYRSFGARADELIGFTSLNSIFQRAGY